MSDISEITKEEFDKEFKIMIEDTESLIKDYMDVYKQLLEFRSEYRKDYKTHHIMHYIEDDILKYQKQESRQIGFRK